MLLMRVTNWFIGDYLKEEKDIYKRAKIELTCSLLFFVGVSFPLLSVAYLISEKYITLIITTSVSLSFLTLLFLLKYKKDLQLVSIVFAIMGYIVLVINLLFVKDTPHVTDGFWMILSVLYTMFVLGKKWGLTFLLIYLIPYMIYARQLLIPDFKIFNELGTVDYLALMLEFCIVFVSYYFLAIQFFKATNLAEEKLKEANIKLQKEGYIKATLLKEVHHRVKNNLQVVNSLLRFQSREFEDEYTISMFKAAQDRVLSMALLHEKMYLSDNLNHIDVQDYINLLAEDLIKTYVVGKKIKLDIVIEEVDLGIDTLIPLGLLINEIITNALKYAFENKNEGTILVYLKSLDHRNYEMIIGDNGVGLKKECKSKGIGVKLIRIFTKQLNGKLEQLEQQGSVFKLVFEKID